MKPIRSLCRKAILLGPVPYLAFGLAIIALGAAMQLRAGAVAMGDGGTVFGLFARIGGFVGFIGLLTLALKVSGEEGAATGADDDPAEAARPSQTMPADDAPPAAPAVSPADMLKKLRGLNRIVKLSLPALRG